MVLETINPLSLFALRNYFADLTHAQPLVPETLSLLVKEAGFGRAEVTFLNEPDGGAAPRERRAPARPRVRSGPPGAGVEQARLNEVVFGPQDYALVARR